MSSTRARERDMTDAEQATPSRAFVLVGGITAAILVAAVIAMWALWPTTARVDRIIDERLATRGLAPLPAPSGSASTAPSASSVASADQDARSKTDPVASSTAFLSRLDDLMRDYKPELPVLEDKSDMFRCVTSDSAKTNADVKKAMA